MSVIVNLQRHRVDVGRPCSVLDKVVGGAYTDVKADRVPKTFLLYILTDG